MARRRSKPPAPPKSPGREAAPRHRATSPAGRRSILEALSQIANAELSPEHTTDFFREISGMANDRGAAILLAVHLEDALEYAIIKRLKIAPKSFGDLFGYDSPMGSFYNKVKVAHAIGMITDETRSNLDVIRAIRNAFAHAIVPISFNMSQVSNASALSR
jgi:hypothetical protein